MANQKVYLALPLSVSGVNEVNQGGQVATRLQAHRHDVRDLHSEGGRGLPRSGAGQPAADAGA